MPSVAPYNFFLCCCVLRLLRPKGGRSQAVKEPKCFQVRMLQNHVNEFLRAPASLEREKVPHSQLPPPAAGESHTFSLSARSRWLALSTSHRCPPPHTKVPAPWAWPAHRTCNEGQLCRRDPQPPRVRPPSAWHRDPIPLPPQSRKKGRLVTSSSGHSAAGSRNTMEQKQAAQVKL